MSGTEQSPGVCVLQQQDHTATQTAQVAEIQLRDRFPQQPGCVGARARPPGHVSWSLPWRHQEGLKEQIGLGGHRVTQQRHRLGLLLYHGHKHFSW